LSHIQLLRIWSRNLEQIIVNRLDAIYGGLELKQVRQLQHVLMCENCGAMFQEMSKGARKLKYCLGELLCEQCSVTADIETYEFEEISAPQTVEKASVVENTERSFDFQTYTCACGKELETFEELIQHRETCSKAGNI
jgi:hypothetical protein